MRKAAHGGRLLGVLLVALGLVAVALVAVPMAAPAQGGGTLTATTTILLPPATGSGLRGLGFGAVTAGDTETVTPHESRSGWFQLENIPRNRDVEVTLAFPAELDRVGGGTGMGIDFNGEYVRTCGTGCQDHTIAPSGTVPSATVVHRRAGPPYGHNTTTIDVYVGGQVQPRSAQAAGVYQGAIELTFAIL